MNLTRNELRKLIYFCWKEDMNPPAKANKINRLIGEDTISAMTCQRWINNSNDGNFDVDDADHPRRPQLDIDEQIRATLQDDKYATTRTIAVNVRISQSAVCDHLKTMGKKWLRNRWVPHRLTDEN